MKHLLNTDVAPVHPIGMPCHARWGDQLLRVGAIASATTTEEHRVFARLLGTSKG